MSFYNQLMTQIGAAGPSTNPAENFVFGLAQKFIEGKTGTPLKGGFVGSAVNPAALPLAAAKPNLELLRGEQAATSVLDKAMRRIGRG